MVRNSFLFIDKDECLDNPCHANATCENRDGTHRCYCKTGFSGDGQFCAGKKMLQFTELSRTEIN